MKEAATSGQVIALLAKILVTYNQEFASATDGEQIQNAIDEKDGKRVVKNLVHFINNGCNMVVNGAKVISSLFLKTKTVTISRSPKNFIINKDSVMEKLQSIMIKEAEKGNPIPFIDSDIWNYFIDQTVPGVMRKITTVVYRFLSQLSHQQILEEAENLGIKRIYSYLEALHIIRKIIFLGEVDQKGTGIFVYFNFKIDEKDVLYRFNAFRNDDGKLNLNVNKVNLDNEYNAGDGACFRNNTFLLENYSRRVFFSSPFFHPPSILPISFSCSDSFKYLSVAIHLFSQAICKKNFIPSSFEIAIASFRTFVSGGK